MTSDDSQGKNAHHGIYAAPAPVEYGGRVELRLLSSKDAEGRTVYGARWFTADLELDGQVTILPSERPVVTVDAPPDLPSWLEAFTTTLVRTTARSTQKGSTPTDDAAPEPADPVWPRRLTRWRKAPREDE